MLGPIGLSVKMIKIGLPIGLSPFTNLYNQKKKIKTPPFLYFATALPLELGVFLSIYLYWTDPVSPAIKTKLKSRKLPLSLKLSRKKNQHSA